jgi:ketosteroid isomerase-like protein
MKTKLILAVAIVCFCYVLPMQAQTEKPKKVDAKKVANTLKVGTEAFEKFKNGLQKNDWQPFFEMLTDDFVIFFPTGKYQGERKGKDKAIEFFKYVGETFKDGLNIVEVLRVTANETTIVFEMRDEGVLRGNIYKNRVALSWDVRGNKISSYREYFGSDGKSN